VTSRLAPIATLALPSQKGSSVKQTETVRSVSGLAPHLYCELMTQVIEDSATINAPPSEVWRALTDPDLMKQWIAEPVMRIEITTDWKVGSPIIVKGRHNNVDFENKGTILQFEPHSILRYSHLSSISKLPDKAENYTIIEFRLARAEENSTSLTVNISNFPAESAFEHWQFYWRITIGVLKRFIESVQDTLTKNDSALQA
jgi:uncharacterized protein YndB with AHSA1/START domain